MVALVSGAVVQRDRRDAVAAVRFRAAKDLDGVGERLAALKPFDDERIARRS